MSFCVCVFFWGGLIVRMLLGSLFFLHVQGSCFEGFLEKSKRSTAPHLCDDRNGAQSTVCLQRKAGEGHPAVLRGQEGGKTEFFDNSRLCEVVGFLFVRGVSMTDKQC